MGIDKPKIFKLYKIGWAHFCKWRIFQNFAHGEFNKEHLSNAKIKDRIKKRKDVFERGYKIKKIIIDKKFSRLYSKIVFEKLDHLTHAPEDLNLNL